MDVDRSEPKKVSKKKIIMGIMGTLDDDLVSTFADYQQKLSLKVIVSDMFDTPIKYVAGFDIDFKKFGNSFVGQAALAVFEWPPNSSEWKPVWRRVLTKVTDIDYYPGYLGLREAPYAHELFNLLKNDSPDLFPQVTLIDGCGVYHPRKCGSATQIGIELDICTIGVSKSFLSLPGVKEESFLNYDPFKRMPKPLQDESGDILANAIYPSASKHPLFVSVGHKITLATATKIVFDCCKTRIPEPIRIADSLSRCSTK